MKRETFHFVLNYTLCFVHKYTII